MVRTDIDMITVVMKYQNDWSWSVPLTLFIYQTAQVKVSEQDIVIIFLSEFRKHYLAISKPLKFYSFIMHFKKVVFYPVINFWLTCVSFNATNCHPYI